MKKIPILLFACFLALHGVRSAGYGQKQYFGQLNELPFLHAIDFVDSLNGWCAGAEGTVVHTSDAGHTWEVSNIKTNYGYLYLNTVDFINAREGWVAGSIPAVQGIILHKGWADGFGFGGGLPLLSTQDGGKNWKADSTMIAGRKLFFTDSLHGWILRADGRVWYTID